MANVGARTASANRHSAPPPAHAIFSNRNNTSFKIPRNLLKLNLEPNPNRNKNTVWSGSTARGPRISDRERSTSRAPKVTNHDSRRTHPASPQHRIAFQSGPHRRTQITNRAAAFTNHQSPLTNHAFFTTHAHVTMLQAHRALSRITSHDSQITAFQSPTRAIRNRCISHKTNTRAPIQSPTFDHYCVWFSRTKGRKWRARRDSNSRPSGSKPDALSS